MNWNNALTQILKIKYPLVQAPMLGVSTPEMVAAVSNEGGLGSLPVGLQSPEKTRELIIKTKTLTDKPFSVNLFAHDIPTIEPTQTQAIQEQLRKISEKYGVVYTPVDLTQIRHFSYQEQLDVLIEEKIPVVSFTFGVLDQPSIERLHAHGMILIGTATSVREALYLENIGIDIVTAQGIEAGGHRGTFLFDEPLPQIGLISLLPQVVDAVKRPVLAAGGVTDPRAFKAAMILGAQGVQVGTAFIGSDESLAITPYKEQLSKSQDTDTVLTRAFSGRWARGIRNSFHDEIQQLSLDYPAYPILNTLTAPIRIASQKQGNTQLTTLWAGQSAAMATQKSSAKIFRSLIAGVEQITT